MLKYAKVIDEETKLCEVGTGTNEQFYLSLGMTEQEVEQGFDGGWYLLGYAPQKPDDVLAQEEIERLKRYLSETDYVVLKIAEGVATAEEYAKTLQKRQEARARINELEG